MRIAQIAPLAECCPPRLYGGIERIVSYLTEELVRQGHDVTLYASGDSKTQARLVAGSPTALRLNTEVKDAVPYHIAMLDQVLRDADEFDVLNFHTDILHFPMIHPFAQRTVTTLHGRLDIPDYSLFYGHFPDAPLMSISVDQRRSLPADANWLGNVYHGIPRDLLPLVRKPEGDYLAFLGRISPEKRPDRAIEIAVRSGLPLRIAAKVDKVDEAYWHGLILPMIEAAPNVEFIGEINEQQKAEFLGNARALLFPIDWPEPFGLTMIEAMACGTPVIAFRCGSVPEVIDDGVSGYIVDSVELAVAAVGRLSQLDRSRVRATFESRFTVERMACDYLALYQQLVSANHHARQAAPYSVPATASLQEQRACTLKHNDTFGVFDPNGDILAHPNVPQGLFHSDTRHLSQLSLTLNGVRPMLLSSTIRDDNTMLTCDLTNPDLYDDKGQMTAPHDLIHLRRSRFLWQSACHERLTVRNYDERPHRLRLTVGFAADFKDLFEVRGTRRQCSGELHPVQVAAHQVLLSYTGLDQKTRCTRLRFDPVPDNLDAEQAIFELELQAGESRSLFMDINCAEPVPSLSVRHAFFTSVRDARRQLRTFSSRAASIETSNTVFNEAIRRSVSDLYMLTTKTP